jgi:hypothetical protein
MLRGDGVPRWSKLEPVVRVLASWNNPRVDVDAQAARFLQLWSAVQTGVASVLIDESSGPQQSGIDAGPESSAGAACHRNQSV